MNEALVQNPEHDVHRDDGCNDQHQLVAERRLKCQCRALEDGDHARRHADLLLGLLDRIDGLAERGPLGQIE